MSNLIGEGVAELLGLLFCIGLFLFFIKLIIVSDEGNRGGKWPKQ